MGIGAYTSHIICAAIETILAAWWIFLFLKYHSAYNEYIAGVDKKQYFMTSLFFIGYGMLEMLHINMESSKAKKG